MALAGYAVGADHGFILTPLGVPAARSPRWNAAAERARRDGLARGGHRRQRLRLRRDGARGRRLLRGRRGDGAAGLLEGLRGTVSARPPFPAERACTGSDGRQQRRDARQHPVHRARRAGRLPALSPGATPGSKLVCFNERFASPGVYEVPLRQSRCASSCEDLARRDRAGAHQGAADRRPARRDPARLEARHRVRLRRARGARAAWSGTAASSASTSTPTCARSRATCCASAPTRAAASASPAASGCAARYELFAGDAPVEQGVGSRSCWSAEVASLCAHGGGMPAPIRSLLEHFPDELGLADAGHRRRQRARGGGTARRARGDPRGRRAAADALLRRAPGAVRRLPLCLVGLRGRTAPVPACTTPLPRGRWGSTPDDATAAGSRGRRRAGALRADRPPAPTHQQLSSGRLRARSDVEPRPLRAAPPTRSQHDERHPYLAFQHELCISCGRCVRACDEVQGAFAPDRHRARLRRNVTAGLTAASRLQLRLLRRLRGHLPHRRDHRAPASYT